MGLLDDAIRDHLDLKRRRGADPAEIERAEREALGPVRREPEPLDEFATEHPAITGDEPPYEFDGDSDWDQEPDQPTFYDAAAGPPLAAEDEPAWEADESAPGFAGDAQFEEPHEQPQRRRRFRPFSRRPAPEPSVESDPGQETVEYEYQPHEPDTGDAMLEETPEFPRDTPDHDHQWFEQRPPKDSDLDG